MVSAKQHTVSTDEMRKPAAFLDRNNAFFRGSLVRRTTFVGREREQATLRQYLDQVLQGLGAVVMISGTAGVGKTRLVAEFCLVASDKGVQILGGAC